MVDCIQNPVNDRSVLIQNQVTLCCSIKSTKKQNPKSTLMVALASEQDSIYMLIIAVSRWGCVARWSEYTQGHTMSYFTTDVCTHRPNVHQQTLKLSIECFWNMRILDLAMIFFGGSECGLNIRRIRTWKYGQILFLITSLHYSNHNL